MTNRVESERTKLRSDRRSDMNRLGVSVVFIRYANHQFQSCVQSRGVGNIPSSAGPHKDSASSSRRQRLGQTPALKGAPIAFSKTLPSRLTKDLLLNEALCAQTGRFLRVAPQLSSEVQDVPWHEPMRAQWDDVTQWFAVVFMLILMLVRWSGETDYSL